LLAWVRENIAGHGGDPGNVFLMGNSAGATHVATYLFHAPSQLEDGPGVRGAILSSGAFGAGDGSADVVYYGDNAAERDRRSPLGLADTYDGELVPVFLWTGEYDPDSIVSGVRAMHEKLCGKYPACPRYEHFDGHNHVSHVMSIDTADRQITNALIQFYHSVVD
jgi:acetyl esterase